MSCYRESQFVQYVQGELNEKMQNQLEEHLYSCDTCLSNYMVVLENKDETPILASPNFTDNVMGKISQCKKIEEKRSRRHPLIHYTIAAGFTLMLMFSGVFDSLTTIVSEDVTNPTKSGSFSDDMLNRTVEMIDLLNNEKEGN